MSNKVPKDDVNFTLIEITSKEYVEITWKFVDIFSSYYPCNIDIEWRSIWRGVSIGNVFTEDVALSSNDDKRMQLIDSIEMHAYGTSKVLVIEKEKIKCNKIRNNTRYKYKTI